MSLTPESLKQAIDFVCERREPKTKMVYTEDFRAFALKVMCNYVRQVPVTTSGAATQLEYLICDYEAGIESGSTYEAKKGEELRNGHRNHAGGLG